MGRCKGQDESAKTLFEDVYTKNDAVGVRQKFGAQRQIFHSRCSELSMDSLCALDDFVLEGLNSGCMTESEAKLFASSNPRKLIYSAGAHRICTQQSNSLAHFGSDIAPTRLRCCSFHRTSQALSAQVFAIGVFPSVCKLACRGTEDRPAQTTENAGMDPSQVSKMVGYLKYQKENRGVGQR